MDCLSRLGLAANRKVEVVIVTGSREWRDQGIIFRTLNAMQPRLVVHGGCTRGADHIAHLWAHASEVDERFVRAKWRTGGELDRGAGFKRNIRMLEEYPGVLVLAFPFGKASGTRHCMENATKRGHELMAFNPDGSWQIIEPMLGPKPYGEKR